MDYPMNYLTFPPDVRDDDPIFRPELEEERLALLARIDDLWDRTLIPTIRRRAEILRRYARMPRPDLIEDWDDE